MNIDNTELLEALKLTQPPKPTRLIERISFYELGPQLMLDGTIEQSEQSNNPNNRTIPRIPEPDAKVGDGYER